MPNSLTNPPKMLRFTGSAEKLSGTFSANNIRYGISVGRRQPLHVVHLDCIHEIALAGLTPVIIIGSTNAANSPFYEPLANPLSNKQQHAQLTSALKRANIHDYALLSLADVGDMQGWTAALCELINSHNIPAQQAIMHYRKKAADKKYTGSEIIKPLEAYMQVMNEHGIAMWESANGDISFDTISSSHYREIDIESTEFTSITNHLADADSFTNWVKQARADNPDKALLAKLPLTSLDLTLERLRLEKHVDTAAILDGAQPSSIAALLAAINACCSP